MLQGVIQGKTAVKGRTRRYKQLMNDLEENRAVKYKRGSVRSHLQRTCLGRSYIPAT
jgi:hypothetical protein